MNRSSSSFHPDVPSGIDTPIDHMLAVKFRGNQMTPPYKQHSHTCYGHCKVAVCVPVAAPVTQLSAMALQFTRPIPGLNAPFRLHRVHPSQNE